MTSGFTTWALKNPGNSKLEGAARVPVQTSDAQKPQFLRSVMKSDLQPVPEQQERLKTLAIALRAACSKDGPPLPGFPVRTNS